MKLVKKIKVSNFKSFKVLELDFDDFNVIIGPNASGKSNFIQIFKFLRDIQDYGLDNAISLQGGMELLRNIKVGSQAPVSIEITAATEAQLTAVLGRQLRTKERSRVFHNVYEITYKFSLTSTKTGKGYTIAEDTVTMKTRLYARAPVYLARARRAGRDISDVKTESFGEAVVIINNIKGKLKPEIHADALEKQRILEDKYQIYPESHFKIRSRAIMLEPAYAYLLQSEALSVVFKSISIFDFDPKLPKRATSIIGKAELEEDGSNLPLVLKRIQEDRSKKQELSTLITALLPFVETLNVERFADRSMLMKLRERYTGKRYLPASVISDGTINVTALIVALYFAGKRLTIIEEPERNVHPALISEITELLREVSSTKQIVVTTHSAQLVRNLKPTEMLLIQRDGEGFTTVTRTSQNSEIMDFLRNGMGIDELYVQNFGV
jgi:predicted ATPase